MLVPPDNFGLVEAGVYRCSKIESDNFAFLETLKLKSLVVLDAEKPPRLLADFIESNNIELFNLGGLKISNHQRAGDSTESGNNENDVIEGIPTSESLDANAKGTLDIVNLNVRSNRSDQWMLIEKNIISAAFEIILNKHRHNLLLIDSTSTLVGILRKIQKWNFNSIVNEYKIYSGASTKSSYFAENFLDIIQVELVAYEIEQLNAQLKQNQQNQQNQQIQQNQQNQYSAISMTNTGNSSISSESLEKSPEIMRNYNSGSFSRKYSFEDDPHYDEDDLRTLDDEDMDDDVLSASPQIPANLLKLVEKKKQEKSRDQVDKFENDMISSTPPQIDRSSRPGSLSGDLGINMVRSFGERRRSSVDMMFMRMNKQRNASSPVTSAVFTKSFESRSPQFKKYKEKDFKNIAALPSNEVEKIRQKYDYKYYKNSDKYSMKYDNINVIKLKLPPDNKLPEWFIKGRAFWETSYQKLNKLQQ